MSGIALLEFIGALAALIIIHELGHFIVARLLKVEVEEFGIGLPPRILTMFRLGKTEFTLNALPLGGFVRPKGENDPSIKGGLAAAHPAVRIAVYLAGPAFNLAFAVLLYTIIYVSLGAPDPARSNVVLLELVERGSPAQIAGLEKGDIILKVNDEVIDSAAKLTAIVNQNRGVEITIEYQRGEAVNQVRLTPRKDPPPNQGAMGVIIGTPTKPLSPLVAFPQAVVTTYRHSQALIMLVSDTLRGMAPASEGRLVGLKGMYDIYQDVRQEDGQAGFPSQVNILAFFTSITISLGLLNLLPIPALDGGRILLSLPELLFRRRFPPKVETALVAVSFALLLFFLLVVNIRDFIDPVSLP